MNPSIQAYRSIGSVRRTGWRFSGFLLGIMVLLMALSPLAALAQAPTTTGTPTAGLPPLTLNIGMDGIGQPKDVDVAIQVLFAITLLSMAPSIVLLMTCFSRIVIVLSFVRNALTLQGAPANQVIIGLSLVMEPVWSKVQSNALQPYMEKKITSAQAVEEASKPIRSFMLRQTRAKDVELFVELAKIPPTAPETMPLRVVIPAFIISELRTAFQMGFLIFVPFILIDIVVATVLMSMGMMMMPPATIALPLKILLFVLVDGWSLIVRSLLMSFGI
jgi:flagellar biosynthetic protein FliP